ncbi:CRIB domain-containing protein RIC7-like [Asparagus officinalis]|uniref:CRIB domain-containing protein RIC7-like n=1 Tax=Asparagus officinalis TaxID=4686 RepID=UPI00098E0E68|nr:CRIB domain-containing protein RIC7-like [Asparagus officinalis]
MLTVPPVKVKGLLKGLRYISGIFENEKEQEMVIGNPTDVKHVAHIGFDGPVVNNPAWMNDLHSAPLSASVEREKLEVGSPKTASQEIPLGRIPPPSPARDEQVIKAPDAHCATVVPRMRHGFHSPST